MMPPALKNVVCLQNPFLFCDKWLVVTRVEFLLQKEFLIFRAAVPFNLAPKVTFRSIIAP